MRNAFVDTTTSPSVDKWQAGVNGSLATSYYLVNQSQNYQPTLLGGMAGPYRFRGQISEVLAYDRRLSARERLGVEKHLSIKHNISAYQPSPTIMIDGNSLSVGYVTNIPFENYGAKLLLAHPSWNAVNAAVGGVGTTYLKGRAAISVDPFEAPSNVLVFWELTNDRAFGGSNDAAVDGTWSYIADRQAAGWSRIVVLTMISRAGITEADRAYINGRIVSEAGDRKCLVADVGADWRLSDWSNPVYFSDGVHLTAAGYQVVADIVNPIIEWAVRRPE